MIRQFMMMTDIQLSPHFRLSEFIKSYTATARGINNTPGKEQIDNLRRLCENVLEPLRQHASQPIIISSGYRCPELNQAVGGVAGSQHIKGEAADIVIPDTATGNEWMRWMADNLEYDQLIRERNHSHSPTFWIHVSYAEGRNRQHVINNLIKR